MREVPCPLTILRTPYRVIVDHCCGSGCICALYQEISQVHLPLEVTQLMTSLLSLSRLLTYVDMQTAAWSTIGDKEGVPVWTADTLAFEGMGKIKYSARVAIIQGTLPDSSMGALHHVTLESNAQVHRTPQNYGHGSDARVQGPQEMIIGL